MFARLARGESNAAIAAALGLTPGTVRQHLRHIYWALGIPGLRDKRHRAARWYRAHPEAHPVEGARTGRAAGGRVDGPAGNCSRA